MAFSEICRICLSVNVRMCVLKKTGLQNLYKTLTNNFMDEDEPIIVCFTCHARLIRCKRLQQQAIESNAVLQQLLAGGSMSIPKPHKARDEIQFTLIYHIDIRPVDCDIENDCKDDIFSLDSVKIEGENFEFEVNENHETETADKAEDLEIDAFGDRHTDSENDLPLIAIESKSKEKSKTVKLKKERRNNKKDDDDIEQHCIQTNNFSKPSEKKIKSNSTDRNINDVRKENLDLKSPTIKSKPKLNKGQPVIKTGKHPAKITKKKILKQKSVNILTKKTSETSTKYIFECDGCSKKFLTKDILADHISKNSDAVRTKGGQTPVPQVMDIFNCDICEFKTSQRRCILAHLKPFSCHICEYRCITKSHMQTHMRIHTGEKPFSCNICEFRCNTKSNLQTHMRRHTGEKPFSCNICEYRCIKKTLLQTHMTLHTGEKPFSCNICKFRCNAKSNLYKHMKIHTGEKPFSCNICEFRCNTKSNLQKHMKIHTKKRLFSCNTCEYKCIRRNILEAHLKIHTGEKPFSCNICEYRCIRKSDLQRHRKKHTGAKPFS